MQFKSLKAMSLKILGDFSTIDYERKVVLVMYYSELLAINFVEIASILDKISREKILNVFYLDAKFTNYIYTKFLNSEIQEITEDIYDRLVKIQELFYYTRLLRSNKISFTKQ